GAAVFSRVTFAGLVLNFAAIPLMALAQLAGMILIPIAVVSMRVASAGCWMAFVRARGLGITAGFVRFVPVLTWRVAAPGLVPVVLYYVALVVMRAFWRSRPVRSAGLVCWLAAAVWIAAQPWRLVVANGDGRLHVTFLDVGQGDAALLRWPRG